MLPSLHNSSKYAAPLFNLHGSLLMAAAVFRNSAIMRGLIAFLGARSSRSGGNIWHTCLWGRTRSGSWASVGEETSSDNTHVKYGPRFGYVSLHKCTLFCCCQAGGQGGQPTALPRGARPSHAPYPRKGACFTKCHSHMYMPVWQSK